MFALECLHIIRHNIINIEFVKEMLSGKSVKVAFVSAMLSGVNAIVVFVSGTFIL